MNPNTIPLNSFGSLGAERTDTVQHAQEDEAG